MLQRLDRFRTGGSALAPTHVASQVVIDWPAVVDAWQFLGETDHRVPSSLPGFNVETVDKENLHEPPSTICPVRGHCSPGRHAGVGGKGPPLHVCPGPKSGGGQRMYIRPQGSGHLGVDPPLTAGQAMEAFQGGKGFPGATTVPGATPPPAYGRIVHQGGEWKIYAAAVVSFATLYKVGEISSLRRSNISKVGITYLGIPRHLSEEHLRLQLLILRHLTWGAQMQP